MMGADINICGVIIPVINQPKSPLVLCASACARCFAFTGLFISPNILVRKSRPREVMADGDRGVGPGSGRGALDPDPRSLRFS